MIYVFGEYILHTTLYELRRLGGAPCKLEPQAFNVLVYLIQQRARVVTRDELLQHLWASVYIDDTVVSKSIMEARKAVGDSRRDQHVIKTIHGRGYRFIAPTVEYDDDTRSSVLPRSVAHASQAYGAPLSSEREDRTASVFQDVFTGEHTVGTVVCGTLVNPTVAGILSSCPLSTRQAFLTLAQQEAQLESGILTYFGAAGILLLYTHEAHAQRAVRAALHLQEHLQTFIGTGEVQHACNIAIRYGVHTGPLPLLQATEMPWSSSWTTAETTIMAIWLHYLACPSTLLSSQATLSCLDATLSWVEHGLVHVPMQTDLIMAYRIGSFSGL